MHKLLKLIIVALSLVQLWGAVAYPDEPVLVSPAVLDVEEVDGFYVSRRLASVRVYQDAGHNVMIGSGTIIGIGEYGGKEVGIGVSASHILEGNPTTFAVQNVQGKTVGARVIDRDSREDVMVFVVESQHVLGVAPVADDVYTGDAYAIGFPNGVGPNEKALRYVGQREINHGEHIRDAWWVESGYHSGGDSGGGIFSGEMLVGVLTHGPARQEQNQVGSQLTIQAAPCGRVRGILRRNRGRLSQCEGGQCTPRGPRDLNWLNPNVDIEVPRRPNRPIEQAERPLRLDINRDREQKKAIAELQVAVKDLVARVEELEANRCRCQHDAQDPGQDAPPPPDVSEFEQRINELEAALAASEAWNKELSTRLVKLELTKPAKGEKGDPGPQGPAGPQGEPGEPAPPRAIEIINKWVDGTVINTGTLPADKSRVIQLWKRSEFTSRQDLVNWKR